MYRDSVWAVGAKGQIAFLAAMVLAAGTSGQLACNKKGSSPSPSTSPIDSSIAATSSAPTTGPDSPRTRTKSDDAADDAVFEKLEEPVDKAAIKCNFSEAFDQYSKITGIQIDVKWAFLLGNEKWEDYPISLTLTRISKRSLLEAVLVQSPILLEWDVIDGKLCVSTVGYLRRPKFTRSYSTLYWSDQEAASRANVLREICRWYWPDCKIDHVLTYQASSSRDGKTESALLFTHTAKNQRIFARILKMLADGASFDELQKFDRAHRRFSDLLVKNISLKDTPPLQAAEWFAEHHNLPIVIRRDLIGKSADSKMDYKFDIGFADDAVWQICKNRDWKLQYLPGGEVLGIVPSGPSMQKELCVFQIKGCFGDRLHSLKKSPWGFNSNDPVYSIAHAAFEDAYSNYREYYQGAYDWPRCVFMYMPVDNIANAKRSLEYFEQQGDPHRTVEFAYVPPQRYKMPDDVFFRKLASPIKLFSADGALSDVIESLAKTAGLPLYMSDEFRKKNGDTKVRMQLADFSAYEILNILQWHPSCDGVPALVSSGRSDENSFKWDVVMGELVVVAPSAEVFPEKVQFNTPKWVPSDIKLGKEAFHKSSGTPLEKWIYDRTISLMAGEIRQDLDRNPAQEELKSLILENITIGQDEPAKDVLAKVLRQISEKRSLLVAVDDKGYFPGMIAQAKLRAAHYDKISAWDFLQKYMDELRGGHDSHYILFVPIFDRKMYLIGTPLADYNHNYPDARLSSQYDELAYFELSQCLWDQTERELRQLPQDKVDDNGRDPFEKIDEMIESRISHRIYGICLPAPEIVWVGPGALLLKGRSDQLKQASDVIKLMESMAAGWATSKPVSTSAPASAVDPCELMATSRPAGVRNFWSLPPAAKRKFLRDNDVKDAVNSINSIALNLYGVASPQSKENLILSPYGVNACLAMLLPGAKGKTREQIAKICQTGQTQENVQDWLGKTAAMMYVLGGKRNGRDGSERGYVLHSANGLWIDKRFKINDVFLCTNQELFGSSIRKADFAKESDKAAASINAWADRNTNGMIKEVVAPGTFDSLTRLALANAIYFKGTWSDKFDKSDTVDGAFHLADGKLSNCKMMKQSERTSGWVDDGVKAIRKSYDGGAYMEIYLPDKVDGLANLEKDFPKTFTDADRKFQLYDVDLSLPKFDFISENALIESLRTLGLTDMFDAKADFSGISTEEQIYARAFIQKAAIKLDEEGTEAAAVTVVEGGAFGMPEEPPPVPKMTFKADHPFLFLIRDSQTGAILFIGRVAQPTKE